MGASNALVATLLTMAGQRNVLTIPRAFVHFTKSIEAAMLLNQLLYWIPRGHDDGTIYKSDKEWQEELCLSRYAVRQARERLESMGFLRTELHRVKGAPTVHYFLDYDALVDRWTEWLKTDGRLSEIEQSDYPKSDNRLFEIEQSDRSNPDNEIVRKQTMHDKESKIPTKTPPPTNQPTTRGGGGGFDPEVARLFVSYGIKQAEPLARLYASTYPHVTLAELRAHCARLDDPTAGQYRGSRLYRVLKLGPPEEVRQPARAPIPEPPRIAYPADVLTPQQAAEALSRLRKKQQEAADASA